MDDARLHEILRHLEPTGGFRPWHGGPTVLGVLRGVTPEVAAWRPWPGRHSIWALVLHVAYWKYAVWRRITGSEETGAFPRSPANWPLTPEPADAAAWEADRKLLREWHRKLVDAIRDLDPARLDEPTGDGRRTTHADLVTGILLHDTWHAGQIQMLKRLRTAQQDAGGG